MPRQKNTSPTKNVSGTTETLFTNPADAEVPDCSASEQCDLVELVPVARNDQRRNKKRRSNVPPGVHNTISQFDFCIPIVHPTKVVSKDKVQVGSLFRLGGITFAATVSGKLGSLINGENIYIGYLQDRESLELLWSNGTEATLLQVSCSIPLELLQILAKPYTVYLSLKNVENLCVEVDVKLPSTRLYKPLSAIDVGRASVSEDTRKVVEYFFQLPHPERCSEEQRSSRHDREVLYERIRRRQRAEEIPLEQFDVKHPHLKPTLRRYQEEAVRWMIHRERRDLGEYTENFLYTKLSDSEGKSLWYSTHCGFFATEKLDFMAANQRGGILADEMGLGKTVELLACILLNPMPEQSLTTEHCSEDTGSKNCSVGDEEEALTFKCFCGELGIFDDFEDLVQCSECRVYQHSACTGSADDDYLCPQCWTDPKRETLKIKATLIICPASISFQWQEESEKHLSSTSVLVYEGVQKQGFISPATLATYDIVLVTYDVLGREIYLVDFPSRNDDARSMRRPQKFLHAPSPLPAVTWWRICLDEAQMVESTTTKCSQMALKLDAVNRWCVTGTPIQKGLKDLYGLLLFLGEEPYNVQLWWSELLLGPYCSGTTEPLVSVLSKCFRRIMKKDVLDQIGVPPQESFYHPLSFSAIEEVFYKRQAQACSAALAREIHKYHNVDTKMGQLDPHSVTLLIKPLTSLRQACCHPQAVRGKFLPLRTDSLTIEELLTCLIKKTTTECEEAHRLMVAAMNGLAGVHIIKDELQEAAEMYRQVLWSAKDHSKDIKTDKLQQLHAVHNLAQLLESCNDGAQSVNGLSSSTCDIECVSVLDEPGTCRAPAGLSSESGCGDSNDSSDSDTCSDTEIEEEFLCDTTQPPSAKDVQRPRNEGHVSRGLSLNAESRAAFDSASEAESLANVSSKIESQSSATNSSSCWAESGSVVSGGSPLKNERHSSVRDESHSSTLHAGHSKSESRNKVYIARAPGDDRLRREAGKLRKYYLDKYGSKIKPCRRQMKEAFRTVKENMRAFLLPKSEPWWVVLLDGCIQRDRDEWLVDRVKADLENKKCVVYVLKDRFTNAHGLQYVLQSELTKLHDTRTLLQKDVRGLSARPSAQDVASAVDCHLRPRKKSREKCVYCRCHEKFNVYESRLFCFDEETGHEEAQDKDVALLLKTRRGNWGDSELEKIIRCLCRHVNIIGEKAVSSDASLHAKLFSTLKNEFRAMRAYYMQVRDFVAALDELEMATVRLEVQLPEPSSRARRGKEDEKPMNVLRPWEVEDQRCKLLAERQFHGTDLKRKLGQLFYLRNLEKESSLWKSEKTLHGQALSVSALWQPVGGHLQVVESLPSCHGMSLLG
ncbi:E3 ubiquitin-protein ligase SHPRH-like isoform X2 [Ornithodoros turicata]|uniref:E3 ubiquitin-protein ligase SHPRH-like isoform X2 n=1 Tax=Ornithodoros turicata TaxID=34597 RepID=UPI003138FA21